MRRTVMSALVGLFVMSTLGWASGGGFDAELYERWLSARVGDGDKPVYWYSVGEVYSYPDGTLMARMEGFDTARLLRSEDDPNTAYQLSRKVFVYRDPETNEILTEVDGTPVQHIKYPYQYITYTLEGDRLVTFVEQGSGARLRKIGPSDEITARRLGDVAIFSAPLFLNFETSRGKYEAFEHYEFFLQPESAKQPYQLSWLRYGDLPPFLGPGKAIVHLVSWRVDSFEQLPATIREYVEKDARLWLEPPKNLEEIRALQNPDAPAEQ